MPAQTRQQQHNTAQRSRERNSGLALLSAGGRQPGLGCLVRDRNLCSGEKGACRVYCCSQTDQVNT